jgi:hypothetical protein
MKKLALSLLFCGASAFATTVTYSTSAVLSGPDANGSGGLTNGGATITYAGVTPSPTTVDAPTNINIGSITTSAGTGAFAGDSIALTITQLVPSAGSGSSSATIDGSVTTTSNGIDISFAPTTITIGAITYSLESTYLLVPSDTDGGVTTLQASVSSGLRNNTTPEPASLGLLGGSLLGLGILARRFKKN